MGPHEVVQAFSQDKAVVVDLEFIGEGISGDYDATDATDVPLARFSVYRQGKDGLEQVDDGSFCTQIDSRLPGAELERLARLILERVYQPVIAGQSLRRLCQELSWINPTWGTKQEVKGWVLG